MPTTDSTIPTKAGRAKSVAARTRTARRWPLRTALAALVLAAAAVPVAAGCSSLFGKTHQVRMEVTGSGSAQVAYAFSGDSLRPPRREKLTWIKKADAGFGFNRLDVSGASPGTTCRILVDGKERVRKTVAADGIANCFVSVQNH
ncbi:hypothetical protein [Actinoallomurus sp. CA-150999]|uniref:hypothetical protein n=1 Tax=Actinoallomurus sp. CA-150999 TaxID=3239887 RepID=UPI003D8E2810